MQHRLVHYQNEYLSHAIVAGAMQSEFLSACN